MANTQVRLAARPVGMPTAETWDIVTEPVQTPAEGEVVVRVTDISLDPAMRGWLNEGASYIEPVQIGAVMRAGGVGVVVASQHPGFAVGDHVFGTLGVQEYCLVPGSAVGGLQKVDVSLVPAQTYLSALGMPGMTAYFALLDVGQPKAGETVVVSGAAGAVGSLAGQIAKLKGCRVVGIAGGPDKCAWLVDELGFDAAIDYKSENVRKALRVHAPDGVDVYFDNVGGDILDDVLTRLARHARVIVCGAISQYNATEGVRGPANYLSLLVTRSRMEGMVVFDYVSRFATAAAEMGEWLRSGQLISREHVVTGSVTDFHDTLLKLFSGENTGKLVLKLG